jgi:anti-sigma factor RsiW
MNCPDVQGLTGNYIDGELPEEMCDRIQRHLLRCSECRSEIETLRMAVEVLKSTHSRPAAGEEFVRSALETLQGELEIVSREGSQPGQLVLGITAEG